MVVLFFVPLLLIAIWETNLDPTTNRYTKNWFLESDDCDAGEDPAIQDPEVEEDGGRTISKVPFEEIIKAFPDAKMVCLSNATVSYISLTSIQSRVAKRTS